MVLNYIWIAFFLIAFVVALVRLIFFQDYQVFSDLVNSTFDYARTGFEISLGLTGVLTLWMGFMKIAEKGGMVAILSKAIGPLFSRLFPSLPKNHPAYGSMMMNLAANMLGLDNAATPMGLKAMQEMQNVNPQKDRASDAQIMFLVLNTSGLTIIPISIMVYRAQFQAANPADIFLPILLATFFSTMVGLIAVAIVQRIKLHDPVVLAYLGGATAIVAAMLWGLSQLNNEQLRTVSLLAANLLLFTFIITFMVRALIKKVNVYEAFIEGGKE
ncbi:MAG TPA: hypothetical protein DDW62_07420, partial [Marinilabiliaceae bacterium]|nr:hypothetical protein [Marinilabiliaceae bacterium]